MYSYQKLTAITILLIGWQLFCLKVTNVKAELIPTDYIVLFQLVLFDNDYSSSNLVKNELLIQEKETLAQEKEQSGKYVPPDDSHPSYTQGSGTFI